MRLLALLLCAALAQCTTPAADSNFSSSTRGNGGGGGAEPSTTLAPRATSPDEPPECSPAAAAAACAAHNRQACVRDLDPAACGPCIAGYHSERAPEHGMVPCYRTDRPTIHTHGDDLLFTLPPNGGATFQIGDDTDNAVGLAALHELAASISLELDAAAREYTETSDAWATTVADAASAAERVDAAEQSLTSIAAVADSTAGAFETATGSLETALTDFETSAMAQYDTLSAAVADGASQADLDAVSDLAGQAATAVSAAQAALDRRADATTLAAVSQAVGEDDAALSRQVASLSTQLSSAAQGMQNALLSAATAAQLQAAGATLQAVRDDLSEAEEALADKVDVGPHSELLATLTAQAGTLDGQLNTAQATINSLSSNKADTDAVGQVSAGAKSFDDGDLADAVAAASSLKGRATAAEGRLGALESGRATADRLDSISGAAATLSSQTTTLRNQVNVFGAQFSSFRTSTNEALGELSTGVGQAKATGSALASAKVSTGPFVSVRNLANSLDSSVKAVADAADKIEDDIAGLVRRIEVQGSGLCDRGRTYLWVDGSPRSIRNERGINIVIFNKKLEPTFLGDYDTHDKQNEAEAMATVLEQQPMGTIVAFASSDSHAGGLTARARNALSLYGCEYPYFGLREAWAMIGIKGARPGTVAEDRGGANNYDCSANTRATIKVTDTFYGGPLTDYNTYTGLARAYGRG